MLGVLTRSPLQAVREQLDALYPVPMVGSAVPAAQLPDPAFKVSVVDVQRLYGVTPDVFVSDTVPGGVLLVDLPRPMVFIEQPLIDLPDAERRFISGARAFEPLRGGYSLVTRLQPPQRAELAQMLEQLVKPDSERDPQAQEFVRSLPRKSQKAIEKLRGQSAGASGAGWYAALVLAADRAGLLACDDVGAAARVLARLSGENSDAATAGDGLAMGQVPGVSELVRFFLSDACSRPAIDAGRAVRGHDATRDATGNATRNVLPDHG